MPPLRLHGNSIAIELLGKPASQERKERRKKLAAAVVVMLAGGLAADLERGHAPTNLTITPAQLAFDPQLVNTSSPAQFVRIANSGTNAAPIGMLALSKQAGFSWDTSDCMDGIVRPAGFCDLQVTFRPNAVGTASADLIRTSTGQRVVLNGTGIDQVATIATTPPPDDAGQLDLGQDVRPKVPPPPNTDQKLPPPTVVQPQPAASLLPESRSYGSLEVGAEGVGIFTLRNSGNVMLRAVRVRLEGEHGHDFELDSSICGDLKPGGRCVATVRFAPQEPGQHTTTLAAYTGETRLAAALLTGAARPKPMPHIEFAPNPLDLSKKQKAGDVVVRNTGAGPLAIYGFTLDNSNDFQITPKECQDASPLRQGESCKVHVVFKGKKTATAQMGVNHSDVEGSKTVVLFAEVSNGVRNKILTGLLAAGVISALAVAATNSGSGASNGSASTTDGSSNRTTTTQPGPKTDVALPHGNSDSPNLVIR